MYKIFLFCVSVCVLYSCHQKDAATGPVVLGQDYYPLDSGRYWIYTVHQHVYNVFPIDTTFQLKEVVYDTIHYANNIVYVLYRFYRPDSTYAWPAQPDSVWTLTCTNYELDITENEVEYVRLAFPLSNSQTWNGNARNILGAQPYSIINFKMPFADTISSSVINNYPYTCNVQEAQTLNLVNKDYRNRVYAKGIGLVYKNYETVSFDTGQIGLYVITFGATTVQRLISYGKP